MQTTRLWQELPNLCPNLRGVASLEGGRDGSVSLGHWQRISENKSHPAAGSTTISVLQDARSRPKLKLIAHLIIKVQAELKECSPVPHVEPLQSNSNRKQPLLPMFAFPAFLPSSSSQFPTLPGHTSPLPRRYRAAHPPSLPTLSKKLLPLPPQTISSHSCPEILSRVAYLSSPSHLIELPPHQRALPANVVSHLLGYPCPPSRLTIPSPSP